MVFKISGVAMGVGRHTLYNLAGSIVPMLPALITVPIYLHLVGATRYGVLALVWTLLGYFGLFDPGLSRAAAYQIARLHDGAAKDRESVFWTAMAVNLGFGLVGGVVFYFGARPLFSWAFKMPEALRGEVFASLPWLAASIPVGMIGNALGGVLQAREWFGVSNILAVAGTFAVQIVPLAVAYFHGPELDVLIPAIVLTRAAMAIPVFIAVASALPLGAGGRFDRSRLAGLFSYGGWITITNLLAPVLTTIDRVLIGTLLSAAAVAYYTVAFTLATRVSVVPGALAGSLFPKLSRGSGIESARLAGDAVTALAAVMTPLVVGAIIALPIFMRLWVGAAFAAHAAPVGMILLLGIWVNGLAYIPYNHLQARNRPDLTAKFHVLELAPFLFVLWCGLHFFGIIGAAGAFSLRVTADAILLFAVTGQWHGWRMLLPGAGIVLLAPFCAPRTLLSPETVMAGILECVAIAWGWQASPMIRGRFKSHFVRISLTGAR
jgi:O-antigen/teichoic acid export membrane protein